MIVGRYLKMAGAALWGMASRRKRMSDEPSPLARVLSLLDLTLLGVGSTLGLGVYVLAGQVAKTESGPAVLLAFIVAAVASCFAGLCYAEFAARVPKAGSAYVYAYVAVGEMAAFVIGWTLILEYAIGTASVTRGVSVYIDNLLDHKMAKFFNDTMHMDVPTLAPYPDFFSFSIVLVLTGLLAFGVKESSIVNNVLTFLNLGTAATAVVAGALYADPKNWSIPKAQVPAGPNGSSYGAGGFFPYGFEGVIKGAGTCFFGFVGFDCIATTSEEAKNPRRNIPLAIVLSLAVICATYCSIATVLTLMRPYYEQDPEAPFTTIFNDLGLLAIKWIVTVGAIFALTTSLLGTMIPLPRVMYAMAQDGLLFAFLANVNDYTKTPLTATIISGALSGVLALIFDLQQLIEMMSIGTLLAYTVVGLCVLVLRYADLSARPTAAAAPHGQKGDAGDADETMTFARSLGALVNWEGATTPTAITTGAAGILVLADTLLTLALCVLLRIAGEEIYTNPMPWLGSILSLLVPIVIVVFMLARQPTTDVKNLSFSVPGLPYVPALSLFLNLYLMANLDAQTWFRFVFWMVVGAVLYFAYSVRHSTERLLELAEKRGPGGAATPAGILELNDATTTTSPLDLEASSARNKNENGVSKKKRKNDSTHL